MLFFLAPDYPASALAVFDSPIGDATSSEAPLSEKLRTVLNRPSSEETVVAFKML